MKSIRTLGPSAAVIAAAVGLLLSSAIAHAQVQKSGKAKFQQIVHWDAVGLKHPEGVYAVAGRISALMIADKGEGFGHGMTSECAIFLDISDLPKGTFPMLAERCISRDASGDLLFTAFDCSTNTFSDLCKGKITGGTGKFTGISGLAALSFGGPAYIRRGCLAAAKDEDCRTSYATSGGVPVGTTYGLELESAYSLELEWRIP